MKAFLFLAVTWPASVLRRAVASTHVLLFVCLLALPGTTRAIEDPPGCSLGGYFGNQSQGGINFANFAYHKARVGHSVPVYPSFGMDSSQCRAINATGSVWIAGPPYSQYDFGNAMVRLTNFLSNVTLDPGALVQCPANALCQPGPYLLRITPEMVGAGIVSPNGNLSGRPGIVAVVENGNATALIDPNGPPAAHNVKDFHTANIQIVGTNCFQVVDQVVYPPGTTCIPAGAQFTFRGYVTNCGDVQLTNVTLVVSRCSSLGLYDTNGAPLAQPMTLAPGQGVGFQGSFLPEEVESCFGWAAYFLEVIGVEDPPLVPGPSPWMTNMVYGRVAICPKPTVDFGLRANDGHNVIRIAGEPPAVDGQLYTPLRITKGTTNYGIKLVETNSPNASRIRIPTPAGVKAWRQLP